MFSEISFCRFATFRWLTGRFLFLIFPFIFLTVRFLMSNAVRSFGADYLQRRISPICFKMHKMSVQMARRLAWEKATTLLLQTTRSSESSH